MSVLCVAHPYLSFMRYIPNGGIISHPCFPNVMWYGLGHELVKGKGVRNPFGRDFEANGNVSDFTKCSLKCSKDLKILPPLGLHRGTSGFSIQHIFVKLTFVHAPRDFLDFVI